MDEDIKFLKETLKLAKKGLGWTNPNPMVGTLIVKDGKIIGKGYHKKAGLPHAEIEALNSCKRKAEGATLYVNLEPCVHFGKTPPCVDTIIKSKIKRVVCCSLDPNPKVAGLGIARLKQVQVEVSIGSLAKEARILNEAFFTFHEKKRPFIAIKFAASLDGKIATFKGDSKWITNEKARRFARSLRSQYQAVLVGINTVLKDNPNLTVRIKGKKDPLRIILDSNLKIPLKSNVLKDNNVLIATTAKANKKKGRKLQKKGVSILTFKQNYIPLLDLLKELKKREIISILIEGGSTVIGSFLDMRVVDKVYAFHSPILIGGEKGKSAIGGEGIPSVSQALHLKNLSYKRFDDNLLTVGYVS